MHGFAMTEQIPECENCHAQMVKLGKIPASLAKPALKVFRCYGCNGVKTCPALHPIRRGYQPVITR